jgi:endoglucanase
MTGLRRAVFVLLFLLPFWSPSGAQSAMISAQDWQAYKAKFLDASGRIVDDGNGGISHSEGQGYGLLLAYLAASPADFEQIWSFTRTELLIRDDGLAAWKWNPAETPHITDVNDATDGDVLIAYALALAADAWNRDDYRAAASTIAKALLDKAVIEWSGQTLLLPGVKGFSSADRADGPVVNPSYWIFEAFPVLDRLAPSEKWRNLSRDGLAMIGQMQFSSRKLPADWVSMHTRPRPADGFAPEFGYNAIRIPLYLMRAGVTDKELLTRLSGAMTDAGNTILVDVSSGAVKTVLSDPGYQVISNIADCVTTGAKLPAAVRQFTPTLYYPSTLQLLGLAFVADKHPECL